MGKQETRRTFFKKTGVGVLGALLAACGVNSAPSTAQATSSIKNTAVPPATEVATRQPTPTQQIELNAAATARAMATATISINLPTPELTPTLEPVARLPKDAVKAIHMGSMSIDTRDWSQKKIDAAVLAVATNLSNITHIAIGTYLDYPDQIAKWSKAAHDAGLGIWVRSAGFNSWQGTFGAAANGTPQQHLAGLSPWLDKNGANLKSGDYFEPVPDELENGKYWSGGIGAHRDEANKFIQEAVKLARPKLDQQVVCEFVGTNPSVTQDVISTETADDFLKFMHTDNYPPADNAPGDTFAQRYAYAFAAELNQWTTSHADIPWHPTISPAVNNRELSEEENADAWVLGIAAFAQLNLPIHGVTLWQFGDTANSFSSRLFNYTNNQWIPRPAVAAINAAFAG